MNRPDATHRPPTLEDRLAAVPARTPAEHAVAEWLAVHTRRVPHESGTGIASAAGVSEMSVMRFLRRLGYRNLREVKAELAARAEPVEVTDDRWQRFRLPRGGDAAMAATLRAEVAAIVGAYETATTPAFAATVTRVAQAERVHVAGFQASRGLALDFATRLKWARPGVRMADGASGTYAEILAEPNPEAACLVLVDTVAYAANALRLAERCARDGVPLVVVTDRFGNWARALTPHVLTASTQIGTFWDAAAPLAALLNLLLDAVTAARGHEAVARVTQLTELGKHFESFKHDGAGMRTRRGAPTMDTAEGDDG